MKKAKIEGYIEKDKIIDEEYITDKVTLSHFKYSIDFQKYSGMELNIRVIKNKVIVEADGIVIEWPLKSTTIDFSGLK